MVKRWLAVALLMASACVGEDGNDVDDTAPVDDDGHTSISSSVAAPESAYDVCEHLPAEPPCSLICDHEALENYVPESSCAVFVCVLTDGLQVSVHACHAPS